MLWFCSEQDDSEIFYAFKISLLQKLRFFVLGKVSLIFLNLVIAQINGIKIINV